MLEVAVVVLAVFCVLLAVTCWWLMLNQRQHVQRQAERDSLRDQRNKELARRLDAYLAGSIRMGEELHELRRVVAPLPDKLNQMEQRDPSSLSFTQAARLAGLGASVDELSQACGLSAAEAELVRTLHRGKT
jgi:C4-dicarboxylate-specific signal transduction histidine kinase